MPAQLRRQVGGWDESKAENQVTAGHMYSQPLAKIGDGKFRARLGSSQTQNKIFGFPAGSQPGAHAGHQSYQATSWTALL